MTIGSDGALYYLNVADGNLVDYDPGPAVDAIHAPIGNCRITRFSP